MNEYRYEGQELDVFAEASHWKQYFKSILLHYIGQCVAEVGAGLGATTAILCDGKQDTWLCIEPDEKLKLQIDKKISSGQLPACCQTSRVLIPDLDPGRQFDTILYIDVLEHIQEDAVELREASQHLAPGGTLIVLSPAHQFLFSEFDHSIGHFRRYNRESLLALTPSGCQVERVYFLDSVGMGTSLANRVLLKQSKPTLQQILFWERFLLPLSRFIDRLTGYHFGRSLVFVWRNRTDVEAKT